MRAAGIVGTGSYAPEQVLTNHDLEKLVDTSDDWISARTGIKERRIAAPTETAATLGTKAAQKAIADAGISAQQVQCIIACTVTPDHLFPVTSCLIQNFIGAPKSAAFDLLVGCTGFVYGLVTACQMVSTGAFDTILVVGTEIFSRFLNWSDRKTCVLFGDGAGAVVVRPVPDGRGLLSFDLGSDGSGGDLLKIEAGGSARPVSPVTLTNGCHSVFMSGNETFRFAVRAMEETTRNSLQKCGLTIDDVDLLVPHQANNRIITAACERLGLPIEKVALNVERYGNTSGASIPLALDEANQNGRVKEGDVVVFVAFGAGLSWGSCVLRW